MERLDFDKSTKYSSIEASIHLCRYLNAKNYCKDKKVLDVACGEGYGSALIKNWGAAKVIGVDCSEEAIKMAKKYFKQNNVEYIIADACKLPFEDDSFDLVVSFETIEHVDDDIAYLKEIKRVAKKDAVIIISCPNDPYYYKDSECDNPFHKRKYTAYDFKKITIEVLGENVHWSYGYGLNGFMSLDESECTHPEMKDIDELKMLDILNFIESKECYRVKADRYLNNWNTNYYVGVWNADVYMPLPVVFFPREVFINPEDPIFADINEWKSEYYEKLSACNEVLKQEENAYSPKKMDNKANQEIQELKKCNDELKKRNDELKKRNDELKKCNDELKKEKFQLLKKLNAEKLKTTRTENLLELADFEKQRLWSRIDLFEKRQLELEDVSKEYERYKNSHSYKIMQPIRRLYDVIKSE